MLEINAESLKFTTNEGQGVIDKISVNPFEAFSTAGFLNVTVRSLTSLASSYVLSYNCSASI